jgi:hypothetical protein
VRRYLRSAFDLNVRTAKARATERPAPTPAPDVESDWNPAALAIRARRAMSTREHVRIRPHTGEPQTGRISRLIDTAPERHGTTLAVEIDTRVSVHLGDVASIGPAARPARRRDRRDPRLAACAHAFGYRGHCLTKSRRYSTSFKALREARQAWVHAQILARSTDATQRAIATATAEQRIATFEWAGTGHVTAADAFLAASAAARAREHRRLARDERAMGLQGVRATIEGGTR